MQLEWSAFKSLVWGWVSDPAAPAWIQAVGALLALAVAIYVSRRSIEHAGLLRQKTIFSIAEAAYEYVREVRAAIELIDEEAGSNATLWDAYHAEVTAGLVRALQGVPVHELASGRQVSAVLGLTLHLVLLGKAAEKLLVAPSLLPGVADQLEELEGDRNARRDLLSSITKVQKLNAMKQLEKIDEHYNVLKNTLSK
ncbi:hypothetical protein M1B34_14925 [Pseudomonas sp. MAFF 302030]|uniref:Uncharacterized protein n=1 Tax=Pseudomonas morbosilactucae TaxID=2938197 RepID=A0A9X2C658_9PSED|nr:hypothetical protein [Pseudomonas morbosilactucae]MCK9798967.1 hypothetical protein [Pseudomonas morbosilactucae]